MAQGLKGQWLIIRHCASSRAGGCADTKSFATHLLQPSLWDTSRVLCDYQNACAASSATIAWVFYLLEPIDHSDILIPVHNCTYTRKQLPTLPMPESISAFTHL